jgi:hypothetical protein
VNLLAPWFLAGFAALVPLVLLHLRRQRREVGVASLLLWRDAPAVATPRRRRARVVLPVALALQALLLVLAVIALAAPQAGGGPAAVGAAPFVVVVDGSTRMAMTDVRPDRLAAARRGLERRLAALPADTPVSVVVAGAAPRLVASRVSPDAARDALRAVRADAATGPTTRRSCRPLHAATARPVRCSRACATRRTLRSARGWWWSATGARSGTAR